LDKRSRRQRNFSPERLGVACEEKFQKLSAEILRDNLATQVIFKKAGFKLWATENDPSSVSPVLDL
jgi:RimJ/RimL family protein N-acetyltransferase